MSVPTIRIFVSSPMDAEIERGVETDVVRRLDGEFAHRGHIEPIFWEHEPLRATASFQEEIPPPAECDIVVCIPWSRLGSRFHPSFWAESNREARPLLCSEVRPEGRSSGSKRPSSGG